MKNEKFYATAHFTTHSGDSFVPEHADGGSDVMVNVSYKFDLPDGFVFCDRYTEGKVAIHKPDTDEVWKYMFKPKYSVADYEAVTGLIEESDDPNGLFRLIQNAQQLGLVPENIYKWEQEYFADFYE